MIGEKTVADVNTFKMIRTTITLYFLLSTLFSYSQSSFGLQIDMGKSILRRISDDVIVPYGFSGADHSVKSVFYLSPSIKFRKQISSRFTFETGLGYIPLEHQIQLKYYYTIFQTYVDTALKINLKYLFLPVSINYATPISPNAAVVFSAVLNTSILISHKDNFEDLLYEEIYWIKRDWYSGIIFAPSLSIGYQIKLRDIDIAELGFYISIDVNSGFKQKDAWGFYNNLSTSRNLRSGLQFKYFINH